ncbi:hypothetical protein NDU88_005151 [Pleurodeles waltl]|uniref:Uncharacterized protein n=1 Tax=Pleurodeles waltl TaxID=8319 RepID=A0AAV7VLX6_PLEWA|nr:hypothetical protein NDU88_005151 [Pleurodeles waltl]
MVGGRLLHAQGSRFTSDSTLVLRQSSLSSGGGRGGLQGRTRLVSVRYLRVHRHRMQYLPSVIVVLARFPGDAIRG